MKNKFKNIFDEWRKSCMTLTGSHLYELKKKKKKKAIKFWFNQPAFQELSTTF